MTTALPQEAGRFPDAGGAASRFAGPCIFFPPLISSILLMMFAKCDYIARDNPKQILLKLTMFISKAFTRRIYGS